jgi:hypothetical protein
MSAFIVVLSLAVCSLIAALALLLHHGIKHHQEPGDSKAKKESSPWVAYFQLSDISNHETWILIALSVSVTLFAVSPHIC